MPTLYSQTIPPQQAVFQCKTLRNSQYSELDQYKRYKTVPGKIAFANQECPRLEAQVSQSIINKINSELVRPLFITVIFLGTINSRIFPTNQTLPST